MVVRNEKHQIICGDSLKVLNDIKNESIDLIITSPPYNIGKSYEKSTSLSVVTIQQYNTLFTNAMSRRDKN